jgi:hypothetical protein
LEPLPNPTLFLKKIVGQDAPYEYHYNEREPRRQAYRFKLPLTGGINYSEVLNQYYLRVLKG